MGFRSTFITEDWGIKYPVWFTTKYGGSVNISDSGVLSSKYEAKEYGIWENLVLDIQKVLMMKKNRRLERIILVWLHECGGIDKVEIFKDKIVYMCPVDWQINEGVSHNYCYGCSNSEEFI